LTGRGSSDLDHHNKESNNSMQSFHQLGVSARIAQQLAARDIHTPFPIQARVLPDALAGRDVLAKSPTGSGKTLAFALPIVERVEPGDSRPAALVLVPTRELCAQVAADFEAIADGLRVATAYGGVPIAAQAKRARGAHVLVATPGRLYDLLERKAIDLDGVRTLVLDEADRMLDMGFKPQVDRIVRRLPRDRQTMFFSATLDGEVGELARQYTSDPARHEAGFAADRRSGTVEHRFVSVTAETKVEKLTELLAEERGLALVFVRTKRGADRLVQKLGRQGVQAAALHGDLNQRQRERALRQFEVGEVSTLVATDVAARGLDLDDITHVVNFDPPEEHTGYVHRVGRTGRAGRGGHGVTLVLPEQQADVSRVARMVGHTEQFASEGMKVAPARTVYSSRRRGSKWGAPSARRKI
jgi:ATP-dependent RNA helicase RhlE